MKDEKDINKERDELTGDELIQDHEYDGIKELNNSLPKWWLWLFYLSIVFAAVYLVRYEVIKTGDSQAEEYAKEMAAAELTLKSKKSTSLDETNVIQLTDTKSLEEGKVIYHKHCAVCHLSKGEGLVGPNLTDEYWIHGGSIGDIFKTIKVGNPSKGMISWKDQLTPKNIQKVSSYIMSLQGTNPPNAKAKEGKHYKSVN